MKMGQNHSKATTAVTEETIQSKIFLIRGQKIMLDRDLAKLYGVETRTLNQSVKRNIRRFPDDFMFRLDRREMKNWISQFVISNRIKKGIRQKPYAFTEHGILMLSSVLNSERAIQVNIQIMRTFSKLRQMLETHKELKKKIEEMERKYDGQFKIVFDALRKLLSPPIKSKPQIGFHP